jgi:hypothetical protein
MFPSESIDIARRSIWLAVAEHERLEIDRASHVGTLLPPAEHLALATISQIVGYAEVCAVEVLQWIARNIADPLPPGARERALTVQREIEATWEGRTDFVKNWLNVKWAGDSWYQAWRGFVEARNAWAHGSGQLTRLQLAQKGTEGYLSAARLAVVNHGLRPDEADVRRCAQAGDHLLGSLGSLEPLIMATGAGS